MLCISWPHVRGPSYRQVVSLCGGGRSVRRLCATTLVGRSYSSTTIGTQGLFLQLQWSFVVSDTSTSPYGVVIQHDGFSTFDLEATLQTC